MKYLTRSSHAFATRLLIFKFPIPHHNIPIHHHPEMIVLPLLSPGSIVIYHEVNRNLTSQFDLVRICFLDYRAGSLRHGIAKKSPT